MIVQFLNALEIYQKQRDFIEGNVHSLWPTPSVRSPNNVLTRVNAKRYTPYTIISNDCDNFMIYRNKNSRTRGNHGDLYFHRYSLDETVPCPRPIYIQISPRFYQLSTRNAFGRENRHRLYHWIVSGSGRVIRGWNTFTDRR